MMTVGWVGEIQAFLNPALTSLGNDRLGRVSFYMIDQFCKALVKRHESPPHGQEGSRCATVLSPEL